MDKKYTLSLSLVFYIFSVLLITSLLFLVKISISKFNIIASILVSTIFYIFLMRKNKYSTKSMVIYIALFLTIIFGSMFLSSNTFDSSWDGNTYHKTAVGLLKNGWNPDYQGIYKFNKSASNPLKVKNAYPIWNNHYAKGYWLYAASTYSLTGNIESGKSIYVITAVITFLLTSSVLSSRLSKGYNLLISIIVTFNPVFIYQMFSYYNDGLLGNYLIILLLLLYMLSKDKYKKIYKSNLFMLFLVLVILINIKFTGAVYAGIFCIVYYIYTCFKKKDRKKRLINLTIVGLCSLFVGVLFIGYSSYVKNALHYGNLFYPLMGKNKVDIIEYNIPYGFEEMNIAQQFIASNFSNSHNSKICTTEYKIPFTFKNSELDVYKHTDVRVGGFGVLFGGILILSSIALIYSIVIFYKKRQLNILYFLPYLSTIIIMIAVKDIWWARYIPWVYFLFTIPVLFLYNFKDKKTIKWFMNFIFVSLIINSYLVFNSVLSETIDQTKNYKTIMKEVKKLDDNETLYVKNAVKNKNAHKIYNESVFSGTMYNLYDNHKKIETTHRVKNNKDYISYKIGENQIHVDLYIKK